MFSGKTTELIRLMRREQCAGKKTRFFKYEKDIRYSQLASSHDGITEAAIPINDMLPVFDAILQDGVTVVGVDEGQFIANLAQVAEQLANRGVRVIVAALNTDKNRNLWREIQELLPMCDDVITLHAICKTCKNEASWTYETVKRDSLVNIDGAKSYEARCRKCYFSESAK